MLYIYLILSAALIPILDNFFDILRQGYSWWLVPILFVGFTLIFIIVHLAVFVISILLIKKDSESERFCGYYRCLMKLTLPMIFKLSRVKITVTGEEKIPYDCRIMLVSNHINDIDPVIFITAFPDLELGFIAKKEVYDLFPFVAKMMRRLYCIPIDRENNREGIKAILKAIEYIKKDKASIGIFPEGYTSKDGNLQEFRNGAFKIATKSKCPIVVCTLTNSQKVFSNMFRRKTEVFLDVLDVITAEETSVLHTDKIGERVHNAMSENLEKRKNDKI